MVHSIQVKNMTLLSHSACKRANGTLSALRKRLAAGETSFENLEDELEACHLLFQLSGNLSTTESHKLMSRLKRPDGRLGSDTITLLDAFLKECNTLIKLRH